MLVIFLSPIHLPLAVCTRRQRSIKLRNEFATVSMTGDSSRYVGQMANPGHPNAGCVSY